MLTGWEKNVLFQTALRALLPFCLQLGSVYWTSDTHSHPSPTRSSRSKPFKPGPILPQAHSTHAEKYYQMNFHL